jgi:hypothetical protein
MRSNACKDLKRKVEMMQKVIDRMYSYEEVVISLGARKEKAFLIVFALILQPSAPWKSVHNSQDVNASLQIQWQWTATPSIQQ